MREPSTMRRDTAAAGKIPVRTMRTRTFPEALLVRGTILRIADLRSQPAYIRVAVRRPTWSRRMVECLSVPRPGHWGRRSSRLPDVKVVRPRFGRCTLTSGTPSPARKHHPCAEPLVRRAQKNRIYTT